ncbi:outer membrane receptor protein involved in Fe transport [Flavobacterium sp. 270]|uniref:TonB-dependent receptor domain-containing protein n=1 Tax=Flavobacterium sp. 270 TaxID=2512114 RepID=UPI001066065C|nr:TonB-dependent receptor [Flavobacterium sp. 270]TDW52776.1 outer membrane receptor protein involved in Fe transport [Flavobacterium sp. 270]
MKLKIALLFLLSSTFLMAQNTISGKVNDEFGNPLAGVHIQLLGTQIKAETNAGGLYQIENLATGRYTIEVSSDGYILKKQTIVLESSSNTLVNITLEKTEKPLKDAEKLNDVLVKGVSEKQKKEETAQAVSVIEMREAKFKTADLGEVLAQTQGISVRRSGGLGSRTNFSMNGLTGNQIRFFLDGIPLEYHGYTFGISTVPVNLIDRVEVYKGVVPIEFGADALGGAVNLITPKIKSGFSGSFSAQAGSFGTYRTSLILNNYNEKTGFFIKANGFYDTSQNNYKVDVDVADDAGKIKKVTVPRFHDAYKGYGMQLTTGVKDRTWAKELSIEGFFTDYTKEIQHNQLMVGVPYGEVMTYRKSAGSVLTYRNDFGENVALDVIFGYNYRERQFTDVSDFVYNWYGERIPGSAGNVSGEISESTGPSDTYTWNNDAFSRLKASWKINNQYALSFTSAPTYSKQTGDDRLITGYDPASAIRDLFTWVNGADFKINAFDEKLENILFVKHYLQKINSEEKIPSNNTVIKEDRSVNYFGFGNGFRYKFTEQFSTRLTYEYATRLPQTDELFGDGQFVQGNLNLKPERSHNVNFELFFKSKTNYETSNWQVQTNLFLRKIDNQILFVPALDRNNIYQNVFAATSKGVEVSGSWTSKNDRFSFHANSTYQHFYNDSNEGIFAAYKGDRVPNQPYFFANGGVNYSFLNLMGKADKLSLFLDARYVYEFFRSWESASVNPFVIPSQQTFDFGTTYHNSINGIKYSITGEIQNLSNEKNYDFFGVQKPGRSFNIKLVTQF